MVVLKILKIKLKFKKNCKILGFQKFAVVMDPLTKFHNFGGFFEESLPKWW